MVRGDELEVGCVGGRSHTREIEVQSSDVMDSSHIIEHPNLMDMSRVVQLGKETFFWSNLLTGQSIYFLVQRSQEECLETFERGTDDPSANDSICHFGHPLIL